VVLVGRIDSAGPSICTRTNFKSPKRFWAYHQQASCPELAAFVRTMLVTPANSVPSERAWSTMNFVHTKQRNRLNLDTLNKLIFIYLNELSLRNENISLLHEESTLLDLEDQATTLYIS
jgi:hypothetical protein